MITFAAFLLGACQQPQPFKATSSCPEFPASEKASGGDAFAAAADGSSVPVRMPDRHFAIPDGPLNSVQIILERTACYGTCPDYRVEVRGSGMVTFDGREFVTFPGTHRTQISTSTVECLLGNFRTADFWSLESEYAAEITDMPTQKITLVIDGKSKTVMDYAGQMAGMPPIVTELQQAIDHAAQTEMWIKGNQATVPALEAESFDFESRAAATFLVKAAAGQSSAVAIGLLERGTPIDGKANVAYADEPVSAIEAAAMYGHLDLVRALIGKGAFKTGGPALVAATLRASVASENAEVVAEILKYRPDINATDQNGDTALALVFLGAHPNTMDENKPHDNAKIIRMLANAGANPNLLNSSGGSLLSHAFDEEEKSALRAIGTR